MKTHSYKQCLSNNLNLLIFLFTGIRTLIVCSEYLCKKPLPYFPRIPFPWRYWVLKTGCKVKNAVFTEITCALQKNTRRGKFSLRKIFACKKWRNLKKKNRHFYPTKFSPGRYLQYYQQLNHCSTLFQIFRKNSIFNVLFQLPTSKFCSYRSFGTKYSRIDQVNFFKGCLPRISLGPFRNTLSHSQFVWKEEYFRRWSKL